MGSMEMSLSKFWEIVKERGAYHAVVHGSQKVGHNLVIGQNNIKAERSYVAK